MKHINDDANYAAHVETHNELARKKQAIDTEIEKISAELSSSSSASTPSTEDAVRQGLEIEPGKASDHGIQSKRDRLSVLQTQSDQLRKAIQASGSRTERIQRDAAYRVFAANSKNFLKLADQLVAQVEAVIATQGEISAERISLYGRGVAEPPTVSFPGYGFSEQLPQWLSDLRQQVYQARRIQETYADKA